jgi:predicted lipoprotein with Yx(FWY)xxD motif
MRGLIAPFLAAAAIISCVGAAPQHPSTASTQSPPTVWVVDTDTMGWILADNPDLHTLYRYDLDKNGTIACVGTCTTTRKPYLHQPGTRLVLPYGVGGTLGTVIRPDGGEQITYDGHPLYTYTGDRNTGDTNGLTMTWHVVPPDPPS